ncbi:MAG TPA: hypothetical protein VGD23_06960, partial [Sphingomicrobium sp.]
MTSTHFRAGALACALLASTALATPAVAQVVPPLHRHLDANGVDVTQGDFVMAFVEGSIGSGEDELKLVRTGSWWGAPWNNNQHSWDGIELNQSSSGIFVSFGFRRETFSGPGPSQQANGSTLSLSGGNYIHTAADGTTISFSPTDYDCVPAGTTCRWLPSSIKTPEQRSTTLTWDYLYNCSNPEDPLDCTVDGTRLLAVRNGAGYEIDFTYSASNWFQRTRADFYNTVAGLTPQATVTYSYPSATVTDVTDIGGRTWRFTGNWNGQLTAIRRPGAQSDTTTISYNPSTSTVSSVIREGVTTTYGRTVSGSSATMTIIQVDGNPATADPQSVVISDLVKGRPTSIRDPLNRTTSYQYDNDGRLTRVTRPEGDYTHLAYDARGNIVEVREVAKAGSSLADIVATASFDMTCTNPVKCNQPNSTTDARGNVTDYTYDSTHGGILTVTEPAPAVGAVRPQTRYSYTLVNGEYLPTGISSCATGTAPSCVGTADEVKSSVGYDANGNVLTSSSGNGTGTLTATTGMTYDAMGNMLTVDGPLAGSADTTTFRYDALRRRIGTISPDPDGAGPLKRSAARTTYYPGGQVETEGVGTVNGTSDADWAAFAESYHRYQHVDANNRVDRETLWSAGVDYAVVDHLYDAAGRRTCSITYMNPANWGPQATSCQPLQTNGPNGPDRVTRTVYDAAGQVTEQQVAVGTADAAAEATFTYTDNGKLQTLKDGENNLTTYVYDGHDRLSQTLFPMPAKGAGASNANDYEQLTYDASSNVTLRRLRDAQTIGFAYDALNRRTFKDMPGTQPDVTYGYDNLGRLLTASQPGYALTFGYDALGRQTVDGQAWGAITRQYDLAGNITRMTYRDGAYITYDRDVLGRIVNVWWTKGSIGPVLFVTDSYDDLGRRVVNHKASGSSSFGYDAVSRLSSIAHDFAGTAGDVTSTFTHNPASQINGTTRDNDGYAWTGHGSGSTASTANGLNQVTSAGGASLTYDARGNLISDGTRTFVYDAENRLVRSGNVTLGYDPLGRLIQVS